MEYYQIIVAQKAYALDQVHAEALLYLEWETYQRRSELEGRIRGERMQERKDLEREEERVRAEEEERVKTAKKEREVWEKEDRLSRVVQEWNTGI